MKQFFTKNITQIFVWFFVMAYIIYFSYFSILRYKTLYASYYDLGIMHQTVYNTYMSLKTGDFSGFLELTNPMGPQQIKRMAIHNDLLLAFLSPFYFFHSGPETILIIQSIMLGLGALAIFKISNIVLRNLKNSYFFSYILTLSYLLYFPMQRTNMFDFHVVSLATSLLLFMFYFWLVKKYFFSFVFFILSILSKEQVALTTLFFGIYTLFYCHCERSKGAKQSHGFIRRLLRCFTPRNDIEWIYSLTVIFISFFWFIFSVFYLIPLFRGSDHFAVARYSGFGDSPLKIFMGLITNPLLVIKFIFRSSTFTYLYNLLGPLGFLSLLSPIQLLIALPELAINLLSNNPNMRNMIYHYTAVITPFVFISGIYGIKKILKLKSQISKLKSKSKIEILIGLYILLFSLFFAYQKGPLPFAKSRNIHPFKYPQKEAADTEFWGKTLQNENLKISATGQLSPFFTSRRYFYTFSENYDLADYVVIRLNEIYNYPEKEELIPVYEKLINDKNYQIIFQKDNFEVYKKVVSS